MVKKAFVLSAFFLLSVAPAQAQKWRQLGTHDGSAIFYYNPKTFSVSSEKVVSAWTRKDFSLPPIGDGMEPEAPPLPEEARSLVAYEEFDCRKRQMRTVTGVAQEGARKSDLRRTRWQEVAGESLDAKLLDALCREPQPAR